MSDWQVDALTKSHVRDEFACGVPALDAFIRTLARQYEKRELSRTYVAVRPGEKRVYGYYTLSASAIEFAALPTSLTAKLPNHAFPAVLIGRLAVDRSVQGEGLGSLLLANAFGRCLTISQTIGVYAVTVLASQESVVPYYESHGFQSLVDQPMQLYIRLVDAQETLRAADAP